MSGDNTANQASVYGTKGTPAATNKPGNRDSNNGWKDASGNFWIFGGWDISNNIYNDLWKYDPGTGQWTWISGDNTANQNGVYGTKGTAAATNKPGARYGQTAWTDASGNFWVYGGYGYAATGGTGLLNDLWKYNPTTGQWTWVSGDNTIDNFGVYGTKGTAAATNKPGGRYYPISWIDASGNFWIFGGGGYAASGASCYLNDLFKYNPTTGQWTWVSGDNGRNINGVYGTKGTAAATNKPGGRFRQSGWKDASGNFWIFGGYGYAATGATGYMNDLFKYNPTTDQWTWVSGDNSRNNAGVYGTKGTAAATNKPGSRNGQNALTDGSGNFWIFAGTGYDAAGNFSALNDLWAYNATTGNWTWLSGDNSVSSAGVYGTKGTGAATNKPGGRSRPTSWLDGAGNLWSFGGFDQNASVFNDLWKYNALTVLPVREISLQGTHRNSENVLMWQTKGEENTDRFIIERSANGTDYTAVGTVAAVGTGSNRYTFTDHITLTGALYYRIQVKDINGQMYYSLVVILSSASETRLSVYPNPAKNYVLLEANNSLLNTVAKLYDAAGRLVGEFRINSLQQYIDLQHFPKGVLTLRLNNGKAFTIIKE
jgi:N-acetylneuraminic acid mutarotase